MATTEEPIPHYLQMVNKEIVSLKERTGSSQYVISKFIEDKHKAHLQPNFKKVIVQIKKLVVAGKLVKVKASYKLAPTISLGFGVKPKFKAKAKANISAKPRASTAKKKIVAKPNAKAAAKPKATAKPKAVANLLHYTHPNHPKSTITMPPSPNHHHIYVGLGSIPPISQHQSPIPTQPWDESFELKERELVPSSNPTLTTATTQLGSAASNSASKMVI